MAAVAPKSIDVKITAKRLDLPIAGQPATALVIGYDRRAGEAKGTPSRSDTLMLVRANPKNQTISLLSFPRDLRAEIVCPGKATFTNKINAAYANCGAQGTLETVRKLTGAPVNYLITVNFRGFRQLVDKLGGMWMDVDRRYLNTQGGPSGYATINLQPGLPEARRLPGARLRALPAHRQRPLPQRPPAALRPRAEGPGANELLADEAAEGDQGADEQHRGRRRAAASDVSAKTVLSYAVLAYSLPPGHVFQSRIEGLEGFSDLTTSNENIAAAVREWANPDVDSPKKATAVALGEKVKTKAPPAKETTVTVLNGNGVTGSASNASYLLGQRGYPILTPPNGIPANAPTFNVLPHDRLLRPEAEGRQGGRRARSRTCSARPMSRRRPPAIRALANGAMLTAVVGQTFHGTLASAPVDQTPKREPANVVPGTSASLDLLRERQKKVDFPLMVPTVLERSSWIDRERPVRLYRFDEKGKHKTIRLTYKMGSNDYWGVQESNWEDAPVLGSRNFVRNIGGRRYELFYNGPHLHMVVLQQGGASYWVVNTLLDRLSNETMLAIAKGLRPIAKVRTA